MRLKLVLSALATVALIATGIVIFPACSSGTDMPFGEQEDIDFANALWSSMSGYHGWKLASDFYPGVSPHGMFLRMYYNVVNVNGTAYHVIVKDNFGGEGLDLEMLGESPGKYLMAVTAMLQREAAYDADNNDWFWVKYGPDGTIDQNDQGMSLAGRVAKGMDMGCIACHLTAGGGDYLFFNDM